jgi:hypothetical protein
MNMNSRGQGISVNVIIIAAIALVVMVILIALVLNTGGSINNSVNSCETLGDGIQGVDYKCIDPAFETEGCGQGFIRNSQRACSGSTEANPQICCMALG